MATSEITRFVEASLAQGLSKAKISQALKTGGWTEKEIQAALQAFSDTKFPVPVPRKKASNSPREAFFHLTLFTSLYIWTWALGALLFQFTNIAFPLPSESANDFFGEIRAATASIVAAFPVFLLMQHIIRREMEKDPGLGISPIRRWLTYLTLFVAVAILLTVLIFLVLRLLEGDLTSRFLLKAVITGSLAGGVVFHYLKELRAGESEKSFAPSFLPPAQLKGLLIGLIGISVAGAIYVSGGPVKARYLAQDQQRVKDLRSIYYDVDRFYQNEGRLPNALEELDKSPATFIGNKKDLITGRPYGYAVVDANTFQLSSDFHLPSPKRESGQGSRSYYKASDDSFWNHGAGNHSFTIKVATKKKN
jgi:hypothetical protein